MDNNKYVQRKDIQSRLRPYRHDKKKIGFTNGCFDILHAGHVTYLSRASSLVDVLVLGLNSDASVRRIKGEKRPVMTLEHRLCVVCALACVDHVVVFDDPDPGELIREIQPDVLIKGADWSEKDIIGSDFVKNSGGKVERIPLEPDISTTIIINRIGRLYYER